MTQLRGIKANHKWEQARYTSWVGMKRIDGGGPLLRHQYFLHLSVLNELPLRPSSNIFASPMWPLMRERDFQNGSEKSGE